MGHATALHPQETFPIIEHMIWIYVWSPYRQSDILLYHVLVWYNTAFIWKICYTLIKTHTCHDNSVVITRLQLWDRSTHVTNPIRQIYHSWPLCNTCAHMCTLLLQNGALWVTGLVYCGICSAVLCWTTLFSHHALHYFGIGIHFHFAMPALSINHLNLPKFSPIHLSEVSLPICVSIVTTIS